MCHYNQGKYKEIAFVFSCPGQEEKENKRPVSGITGRNLDFFISELFKNDKEKKDFTRYDFRITNSVSQVYYKELNERTEAKMSEIKVPKNIDRLYNEIKDIEKLIICFGKRAEKALEIVRKTYNLSNVEIINFKHLGLQSLNRYKIDVASENENIIQFKIKTLIRESKIKTKLFSQNKND
jgi:uracil-DNA glycosylase